MLPLTRPRLLLAAVIAFGGLAWLVERLVVTDTEAVTAVLDDVAAAASRGDWEAVAAAIDDDFLEAGRGKDAFLAWAKGQWKSASLRGIALDVLDVRVEGHQAAARVEATLQPYAVRVPGRVDLERRGDAWKLVRAAPDNPSFFGR